MGLAVALAGNNNQAAVVNGGATDLGVAGGGRSAANTGYVLANTAMPTAGTTSNYIKTDQFVSVYFLNVFDYIEGTIQLVNPVSESSELVPASNFDNNGAAPNTLNVVWLAIK